MTPLLDFRLQTRMCSKIVEHGGLDSTEAEIARISSYLRRGKINLFCLRDADISAMNRQLVYDGAAGISQGQKSCDFIVGFAGGIVTCLSDFPLSQKRRIERLSGRGRRDFV